MRRDGRRFILILAAVLAVGLITAPALAYFTDHTSANGKIPVELGYETQVEENVDGFVKSVTVNNEGPEGCFIRARAFAGDGITLTYEGKGWSKPSDDGWCYYGPVLEAGETTDALDITISEVPENAQEGDRIDVTVVYESTKALYAENGDPLEPDWSLKGIEGGGE